MPKRKGSSKRKGSTDDLTKSSKKNKRTNLTRSSTKNRAVSNEGETTELLISGNLLLESNNQGVVWSELNEDVASKLSRSVVSLALSDGHMVLFTCSGIAVQREGYITRFLTSGSLAKAFKNKRKYHDNLKVEVRHGDNTVIGFLGEYDFNCNIAAVDVEKFPDIQIVDFFRSERFASQSNLVAVGCDISGKLIATIGRLNGQFDGSLPLVMTTTCKISKVCEGGPLFGFDGNFLGMNLSSSRKGTSFVPELWLIEKLWNSCVFLENIKFPKKVRAGESSNGEMPNYHQEDLESLGYPEPPKSTMNDGIILANNFEEPFGDIYGKGVWSELSETVASHIRDNIVALASFNGKKRFFACTGCLIEWNGGTTILTAASLIRDSWQAWKIVENLRIEVLLSNKKRAEGILQHYNLHYNIALVSVNDFYASQPFKIERQRICNNELLAVGCIFTSGKLMAARGPPFSASVELDCQFLIYTTCRITKAGIGGPLVNFDGKFIGMNFYDKYAGGTPFLSWDEILDVLGYFKTKRTVADAGHDGYAPPRVVDWKIAGDQSYGFNRWRVPWPIWGDPDDIKGFELQQELRRPRKIECANQGTDLQV